MTNPSIFRLLATASLFFISATSYAKNDPPPICPEQISEPSVRLTNIGGGWRSFVASPLFLHSVALTDGPPERLGQLMGKQTRMGKNAWADTYDLRGPFPEGKWLQCSYGMLN